MFHRRYTFSNFVWHRYRWQIYFWGVQINVPSLILYTVHIHLPVEYTIRKISAAWYMHSGLSTSDTNHLSGCWVFPHRCWEDESWWNWPDRNKLTTKVFCTTSFEWYQKRGLWFHTLDGTSHDVFPKNQNQKSTIAYSTWRMFLLLGFTTGPLGTRWNSSGETHGLFWPFGRAQPSGERETWRTKKWDGCCCFFPIPWL